MPVTNHLQTVVFDAAWTLIRPEPRFTKVYVAAGERHGVSLSEAQVGKRFSKHFTEICWDNTGEADQRVIWKEVIAKIFVELESTTQLFDELWQHYSQPSAWAVYDDVRPTWEGLDRRGIRYVVGSNFDERLATICAGHDVFQKCDHIFGSAAMQVSKPQSEFYGFIAERLNLSPQQLLMIGDDWQNDYLGPRSVGWNSLWLNRNDDTPPEPGDSITTMTDLLSLIDDC
jgi:putative hydrolase of the HAD superfamily